MSSFVIPLDDALRIIRQMAPIRAVRASRARSGGWGISEYTVAWSHRLGWPVARAIKPADPDRRSEAWAKYDAQALARRCGQFVIESPGRLSDREVVNLALALREGRVRPQ